MPYIDQERRKLFDPHVDEMFKNVITPGDLNYVITRLCHKWLKINGLRYDMLNTVMGVLTCAQLEMYRRKAAPYEDQKAIDNGDVL